MSKTSNTKLLATIIGKKGGCTLATLLNEAKKDWTGVTRADIVSETEEGVSLVGGLDELVDFKAYTLPVSPEEAAAIEAGTAAPKLRYFFVPKDTVFLGEDDDDEGDDPDEDGDDTVLDLEKVDRFFVVATGNEKSTVEAATSVGAAIGLMHAAQATGAHSSIYAGVSIEVGYEALVSKLPVVERAADEEDAEEGGEGGDAEEEEGDE